jgi:hypothetical protein
MTQRWLIDLTAIKALLEERGFDIDASDATLPECGGSLSARLDLCVRSVVLKIDSGGRLQITRARTLEDRASDPIVIEDVKFTVTDRTTRHRTMRGTVQTLGQLRSIVESVSDSGESDQPPPV